MTDDSIKAAARALGSMHKRKKFTKLCPVCKTAFAATDRGVYCSTSCKLKAQHTRRKARVTAQAEPAES